jgi:hypothetical protein
MDFDITPEDGKDMALLKPLIKAAEAAASNGSEHSEPEPEPEARDNQIDGAKLLDDVRDWLATYICTVTESDLELLALWAAHTHLVIETYTTPRLQLDSPVPESGKTTCLEHLHRLSLRPVQMASLSSPALLTRMLEAEQRTILIDEVDRVLNPDKEGTGDLISVLNSGYKRGGTRPVLVPAGGQWEMREMPCYAAVAMAGNNPDLPEDTRTRTIRVVLLPDLDGLVEESDWELIEPKALKLHDRLAVWALQVCDEIKTTRPTLPDGITGRFREKWGPLKRVANAAGGAWPDAVDALALQDRRERDMDREDGLIKEVPAVVLLTHLHKLRPKDRGFWPTEELIDTLVAFHPTVWGTEGPFGKKLTPQRLGRMLAKGYKIHSDRESRTEPRGYYLTAFIRAWSRMTISAPDTPPAPVAPVTGEGSE